MRETTRRGDGERDKGARLKGADGENGEIDPAVSRRLVDVDDHRQGILRVSRKQNSSVATP